jgi:two-component system phosphate regulon response regulator PhoB
MSQSISLDSADLDRPAPPTILNVDDEAVIVEVLALVLEAEGYVVHARTSGRAALEWLRENPADLVLLDFMMPRMDGGAVGHAIRQLPHGSAVAIVISSALPERSVRERFDGYDAFLQKPYDMDVLLKRVAELSRRRSPAG